jgi:hypothetical protein
VNWTGCGHGRQLSDPGEGFGPARPGAVWRNPFNHQLAAFGEAGRGAAQIKVVIGTTTPTYGSQLGSLYAKVEAFNVGQRTVIVDILTLELPSGARMFTPGGTVIAGLESTRLPAALDDGQTAQYVVSCEEIGRALRAHGLGRGTRLTPVCVDRTGHLYKGKPWEMDPDELVRMATSQ